MVTTPTNGLEATPNTIQLMPLVPSDDSFTVESLATNSHVFWNLLAHVHECKKDRPFPGLLCRLQGLQSRKKGIHLFYGPQHHHPMWWNPLESCFHPIANTQLINDGTQRLAILALEDSLNKGMFIIHIFTDPWVVANGPTVWSHQ